jgi:carboxypeptidase C (cathepsin A)
MLNELVTYSKEIIDNYFPNEDTKKELLSKMLGEISKALMIKSIELENNKISEESCLTMKELTESILKQINHCKKDKYTIKLYNMLKNCNNIKRQYSVNEIPVMVRDLRKTSMEFKALSMSVNL